MSTFIPIVFVGQVHTKAVVVKHFSLILFIILYKWFMNPSLYFTLDLQIKKKQAVLQPFNRTQQLNTNPIVRKSGKSFRKLSKSLIICHLKIYIYTLIWPGLTWRTNYINSTKNFTKEVYWFEISKTAKRTIIRF